MPDTWGWIRFAGGTKGPMLDQPGGPREAADKNVRDLLEGEDRK